MNAPDGIRPLRRENLSTLATEQIAILNSLYSGGAYKSGEYEWRWCRTGSLTVDHWVRLTCGDRRLWLGVAAATIDDDVDFLWRNFEGAARDLAWCASFSPLLEMLQRVFQGDWLASDTRTEPNEDDVLIDADFVVRRAGHCFAIGRCRFDVASIPHVESAVDVPDFFSQLPVTLPIVVDRTVLAAGELDKLEVGAVVRINRRAFLDIGAKLCLPVGDADITVTVTGTKLTVVDAESRSSRLSSGADAEIFPGANDDPQ